VLIYAISEVDIDDFGEFDDEVISYVASKNGGFDRIRSIFRTSCSVRRVYLYRREAHQ